MKERGIIFSGDNPKLIQEGAKTQTRRIVKPQPQSARHRVNCNHLSRASIVGVTLKNGQRAEPGSPAHLAECPHGVAGDRLWVRETWTGSQRTMRGYFKSDMSYWDFAINKERREPGMPEICKWKPSIHMPRWASRITLEILKVRVELLNEISEADARAEGISPEPSLDIIGTYAKLWEKLHGKNTWQQNPWVWVLEFRKVSGSE